MLDQLTISHAGKSANKTSKRITHLHLLLRQIDNAAAPLAIPTRVESNYKSQQDVHPACKPAIEAASRAVSRTS